MIEKNIEKKIKKKLNSINLCIIYKMSLINLVDKIVYSEFSFQIFFFFFFIIFKNIFHLEFLLFLHIYY